MSTYIRGKKFEDKVYKFFKDELKNEKFIVSGKKSKIFKRKPYYSNSRKSDIIVDISIETSLANSSSHSLLILIECKDYDSPIPVNDIEEFYSKVRQISGLNVKAIFVTTAALQKSAFEFAKSNGIALIRYLPDKQFVVLLHYEMGSLIQEMTMDMFFLNPKKFNSAFLEQNYISEVRQFYACDKNGLYRDWGSVLDWLINDNRRNGFA
jgi:hypothetical protein